MKEYRTYDRVSVVKIVDADTFDLEVDLGFNIQFNFRCRLLDYNAPELSTPEGQVAKYAVSVVLANNKVKFIQTVKDRTGKYGRYLVNIFLDNGKNLVEATNEEINRRS